MDSVCIGLTSSNRVTFAEKPTGLGSARRPLRGGRAFVGELVAYVVEGGAGCCLVGGEGFGAAARHGPSVPDRVRFVTRPGSPWVNAGIEETSLVKGQERTERRPD